MRSKNFTLPLCIVFALFTAAGCSKSSNSSSSAGVSATVAGTAFNPSATVGFFTQSSQYWVLTGYNIKSGDTTALELDIFEPLKVNTPFNTINTNLSIYYYVNGSSGKTYSASPFNPSGNATMTVTSLDTAGHKIAGTFTGTLYNTSTDSVVVTNGKFNTSYILEP